MSRGVNDVDFHIIPDHGTVFGSNGDPSFTLQIHGIHESFIHLLTFPEQTALFEHGIHKSSFTVVNMGDNSNISQIFICYQLFHSKIPYKSEKFVGWVERSETHRLEI